MGAAFNTPGHSITTTNSTYPYYLPRETHHPRKRSTVVLKKPAQRVPIQPEVSPATNHGITPGEHICKIPGHCRRVSVAGIRGACDLTEQLGSLSLASSSAQMYNVLPLMYGHILLLKNRNVVRVGFRASNRRKEQLS